MASRLANIQIIGNCVEKQAIGSDETAIGGSRVVTPAAATCVIGNDTGSKIYFANETIARIGNI
jgi:hypothetical protein